MKVDFLKPNITDSDIKNMIRSVKTGWLVQGAYAHQLEEGLKKYLGVKSAVMTGSATAALHMSLILAGVGPGDEVITTPLSWVSTSNVIIYQGAKPVFVDVEPNTGNIDAEKIEEKITPKTKAILLVHLYGQMADMQKIKKIADKHGLKVIEDAAHSLEAERDGIRPGQLGFSACLSFHAAKNITSGQGGAILTNFSENEKMCRLLIRDGVLSGKDKDKRRMISFGYKYDATDFQAALLIGQLKRIKKSHAQRVKIFERYRKAFAGQARISFPAMVKNSTHACHMFVVWVAPEKRDFIREKLREKDIHTSIHYDPIHLEPYYREKFGFKEGFLPVAEKLGASTITLPTYGGLTRQQQDFVIDNILRLV